MFKGDIWNEVPRTEQAELETLMCSAIDRYAAADSGESDKLAAVMGASVAFQAERLPQLRGILRALRFKIENGYWEKAESLIRGEVMEDLLVRAEYLAENGFLPEALTNARVVLEVQLRRLAATAKIPVRKPDGGWQRASFLNDQLQANRMYRTATQHKLVAAWLAQGNDAAHPDAAASPTSEEVGRVIAGVRDFIDRYGA